MDMTLRTLIADISAFDPDLTLSFETPDGQALWAKRLSPVLTRVMKDHWEKEPDNHG